MAKNQKLPYTVVRPLIGGLHQALLIPDDNAQKPLLLVVHGGPGEPMTPFIDTLSGLEARFVVCLWEQRGAAMSYSRLPDDIQVSQFVSDAIEVTQYLLKRFGREKLVLMGFSWGSLVGLLAAAQAPELYAMYIGVGQIADQKASENDAYSEILDKSRAAGDEKSTACLLKIGPPPYLGQGAMKKMMQERTILRKYSENPAGDVKLSTYFKKVLSCPYYRFSDKINYFRGMKSGAALFDEVLSIIVSETVPKVLVPIYVMQGKHDMQTRPRYAEKLIYKLDAPNKKYVQFEKAGHSVYDDDTDTFLHALDTIETIYDPWVRN